MIGTVSLRPSLDTLSKVMNCVIQCMSEFWCPLTNYVGQDLKVKIVKCDSQLEPFLDLLSDMVYQAIIKVIQHIAECLAGLGQAE